MEENIIMVIELTIKKNIHKILVIKAPNGVVVQQVKMPLDQRVSTKEALEFIIEPQLTNVHLLLIINL